MDAEQKRLEANKQLAIALGYKAVFAPDRGYSLILPDGSEWEESIVQAYAASNDEAGAWQLAPDWYGSLDAVIAELPDDADVEIEWLMIKYIVRITDPALSYSDYREGATRKEAGGNSLLAWAEARNAQAQGGAHG